MTDYIVRHTDTGTTPITVPEDTVNRTSLDVTLFGRIFNNYGEEVNEDLLNILENFSCPEAAGSTSIYDAVPDIAATTKGQLANPVEGQFWFNNTRELMYYRDDTEWVPIPLRGSYAANWGQILHGQALPRPVNQQGYIFPYAECIWSVSPASINGSVDFLNCNTNAAAVVDMRFRWNNTTTIVNGIANYLIIGISGNTNSGVIIPPLQPSPSATPPPSATATPGVSPTGTPVPTPTPTVSPSQAAVTVTPTTTPAVTATRTPTPGSSSTPAVTPTVTATPAASPVPPSLPLSIGGGCYITTGGSGTQASYTLAFAPGGNITESGEGHPGIVRGNWKGSLPGDSAANYEIRFVGDTPDSPKLSGTWYPLGSGQTFNWTYTLSGPSGGRFVSGTFTLRRIVGSVVIDTMTVESTQLGVNVECV